MSSNEPTGRRCYSCDTRPAKYEAHLNYDLTPIFLLCDECAIWERDWDSVDWIRTIGLPTYHERTHP